MRVAVFSTKPHDEFFLGRTNVSHELRFLKARLTPDKVRLAAGATAVCAFVSDDLGAEVMPGLARADVRLIALRSAGFNHVDLEAAIAAGITVARVPAYSPHFVAEHRVALILTLSIEGKAAEIPGPLAGIQLPLLRYKASNIFRLLSRIRSMNSRTLES